MYIPPHRRGGSSVRASSSSLDHINEEPSRLARSRWQQALLRTVGGSSAPPSQSASQVGLPPTHSVVGASTVVGGSVSQFGVSDAHIATSTVVSAADMETPALVFHEGVPPERVVELRHLRSSSPEAPQLDNEITPDDSVSVAFGGGGGRDGGEREPHGDGGEAVEHCGGGSSSTTAQPSLLANHRLSLAALSEVQVASLLRAIGLGKYAAACQAVPLRGRDLQHCSAEDLEAVGISFRPHRLSLLEEITKLAVEGVPASLLGLAPHDTPRVGDDDGQSIASSTPTWLHQAQVQLDATPAAPSSASPPPYNPTLSGARPQPPPPGAPGARSQRARASSPARSDCDTLVGALTGLSLKG